MPILLRYQDTARPVKDKSEFKLKSYHDPYRQFDEDDPNIVFVEGINQEAREQGRDTGVEKIIRSSITADKRIQHIKVKGNLAGALRAIKEVE